MPQVPTVLGPVEVTSLGRTLMHEHIFILTADVQQNYPEEWGDEDARVADAVRQLRDLAAVGSGLVVLSGSPERAIPDLADLCDAELVRAAADVSPFARKRDRAVATALQAAGRRLDLVPGTFVAGGPSTAKAA